MRSLHLPGRHHILFARRIAYIATRQLIRPRSGSIARIAYKAWRPPEGSKRAISRNADELETAGRGMMKSLVTRRQALAAASALALAPLTASAAQQEQVGMQLILAADVSGSVNATRY